MKNAVIERLLKYSKLNYLNQSQLGEKLGADRQLISDLKTGRRKMSLEVLISVLELFPELDANWLIRGNTNINIKDNSQHQNTTGKQSSNTITNIKGSAAELQTELEFLRETIKDKNEQIKFLRDMLKNK